MQPASILPFYLLLLHNLLYRCFLSNDYWFWKYTFFCLCQFCRKWDFEMFGSSLEKNASWAASSVIWGWERSYVYWVGMLSLLYSTFSFLSKLHFQYLISHLVVIIYTYKVFIMDFFCTCCLICVVALNLYLVSQPQSNILVLMLYTQKGWHAWSTKGGSTRCYSFLHDCWYTCHSCYWR